MLRVLLWAISVSHAAGTIQTCIWREGGEVRFAFLADCKSESNLQSPRVCFIWVGFVKFQAKLLHP